MYTRVRPESCSYSFVHLTSRVFVFSHDTHLGHAVFLFLSRHPFFPTCHTPFFLYTSGGVFFLSLTPHSSPHVTAHPSYIHLEVSVFSRPHPILPHMSHPILPIHIWRCLFSLTHTTLFATCHTPFFLYTSGGVFFSHSHPIVPHMSHPILPLSHRMLVS